MSVTIQTQQRNGKKSTTSVVGLAEDITLTGDQRENVVKFLVEEQINRADEITIKGT